MSDRFPSLSVRSRCAGSFRDPCGFVFERDGVLYRQVNQAGRVDYDALVASGLDHALINDGALIPHREVKEPAEDPSRAYKVLRPDRVPFLSYPYEWSFGQLKAAALLTLDIQNQAMGRGMSLKDASAFNVQFLGVQAVFIDTLSFETYREGQPWVAYRQFCQHFLAPLALMARVDIRLNQLFRTSLEGVPLDLAGRLLPFATRLNPGLLIHIHLHAKAQKAYSGGGERPATRPFSRQALMGLLDSLRSTVQALRWNPDGTEWADYYDATNYTDVATEQKLALVGEFLDLERPSTVWDLGANTGRYSRLAADRGAETVAFDVDPACVERLYRDQLATNKPATSLLPLRLDLLNPSPGLGWDHQERASMVDRGPVDVAMALALVHHLAISGNVPLDRVATFLRKICRTLIIEFVPKADSQVKRLLAGRVDVFDDYTQAGFETAFLDLFTIERSERIADGERTLYLMRARPER